MTKPWTGTGLEDFNSWWTTERRRGLVYRGDADMEFMNNHHDITVVEFKKRGEWLERPQISWLKVRAGQPKTQVRVVRETTEDYDDPSRLVRVWDPLTPFSDEVIIPLSEFRKWAESRAYTKAGPHSEE